LYLRKGKRNCSCKLSVDGFVRGREIRKSLGTADWQKALDAAREMAEARPELQRTEEPITIEEAGQNFLGDVKFRRLSECTTYKYKLLLKKLNNFALRIGLRYLKELDLPTLDRFRSEWTEGPRSCSKKIERLRAFMRFCERRHWIATNPATELEPPKVPNCPTLPFTREEMLRILAALDEYAKRAGVANAQRVRAFVLLLRYSGMRIGDAVQCGPERLSGNILFLYTQKTGVHVRCVLPDFVVREIEAAPKSSEQYFFWTGKSKLHTAVGIWQQSLQTLFTLAGVQHVFHTVSATHLLANFFFRAYRSSGFQCC
jgi:site-specific recombinase XerD